MYRVAVADPQDSTRTVLCNFLRGMESVQLVAECEQYDRFMQVLTPSPPDVAIVALEPNAPRALQLIAELCEAFRGIRTLAVIERADAAILIKVLRMGGSGYVSLPITAEKLREALGGYGESTCRSSVPVRKCPFCHFDNEEGALFCEQCKSDLVNVAVVPEIQTQPVAGIPTAEPLKAEPYEAIPLTVAEAIPFAAEPLPAEPLPAVPLAESVPAETQPDAEAKLILELNKNLQQAIAAHNQQEAQCVAQNIEKKGELMGPRAAKKTQLTRDEMMRAVAAAASPAGATPAPGAAPVAAPPVDAFLCPGSQPRLLVVRGQKRNAEYPIYEGLNFIGRADEKPVDIDLEDQESPDRIWCSRQHACLRFENGGLVLEDLNSSNGTYVNRTRIYPGQIRELNCNDIIQIGTVQLKVMDGRPPTSAVSPLKVHPVAEAHPVQGIRQTAKRERRALSLSRPSADLVDCTVFAPAIVEAGETLLVQVFVHLPDQAEIVRDHAHEFDATAVRRGFKSLEAEIERGEKLTFHLVMPGTEIDEPVDHLCWRGEPASVQFGVRIRREQTPGILLGTVSVSLDSIPMGHVKFKLTVCASRQERTGARPSPVGEVAHRYRKAFISYASPDRPEVLKRVQMLARLGIGYFQDLLNLEPGDRWEKQLYRHIEESDLFLLFWSTAACNSKWVLEEMRYALSCKNGDELAPPELKPIVIEGPPPPPPPIELAHLHFNDYLLYFMNAPEVQAQA